MNIEERVAEAILTYNRVINVMSPNTVYMGRTEVQEVNLACGVYEFAHYMEMTVVRVKLDNYLQVARV